MNLSGERSSLLVSIILPTYNGSKYLRKSIESCLSQTYRHIEVIIVNDCSTDDTALIINHYASIDKRVQIINNAANQKLPQSLNIGFAASTGTYFTWISDDNIFASDAIATLVESMEQDPGIDIVYSSYYFINEKGDRLDSFGYEPEALLFKCAPGACFLYKKEVHTLLKGFDPTKFRMEDMDFWLRAAVRFRYKYIDQKHLYYYRKHANNLTSAIYSDANLYRQYRQNHFLSFQHFFRNGLGYYITDQELELHLELYFEDIVINKNWNFNLADKVIGYINYLDNLITLPWENIGFDKKRINDIINSKKNRIVSLVINDLVFENKLLQNENPKIAKIINKPISWYYKEYEVLPSWYKKLGHIIKAWQGNKNWRSLINKGK
ncbi:MAG: hypothetical protein JWP69_1124 [Flaviaesturariibacter sp.]|nr:hypothetical protein [Flaviaesturariibacter sp.]